MTRGLPVGFLDLQDPSEQEPEPTTAQWLNRESEKHKIIEYILHSRHFTASQVRLSHTQTLKHKHTGIFSVLHNPRDLFPFPSNKRQMNSP